MQQGAGDIDAGRRPGRTAHMRALLALGAAGVIGLGAPNLVAADDPKWDQVENIKEAATRLAQIQRTQGATKAFTFIDACYRTHSLSSEYTKAFEACIAQDYMETQVLSLVYSRMAPEALKKMGAPTPQMLAQTMSRRVGAAFGQYKVPKERVLEFQRNVDEHGFPLFFKILFPDAKLQMPAKLPQTGEGAAKAAPDKTAPEKSPPEEKSAPETKQ
jgi:hypothetical protein